MRFSLVKKENGYAIQDGSGTLVEFGLSRNEAFIKWCQFNNPQSDQPSVHIPEPIAQVELMPTEPDESQVESVEVETAENA